MSLIWQDRFSRQREEDYTAEMYKMAPVDFLVPIFFFFVPKPAEAQNECCVKNKSQCKGNTLIINPLSKDFDPHVFVGY